ncbi:TPA: hypothetical protein PIU00_004682 [Klebsiella quasipneumoniae subsp. similipneumoniae]|nr:hypothetical protein [Klebsiella quasipneumoniae subsp. similipneumoniae]
MNLKRCVIGLVFFTGFAIAGVQPIDFTKDEKTVVDQRINNVNDEFSTIVNQLNFNIDSSNPVPGANSGWVNGVPTITFTSSLLDVVFYTTELAVLNMNDSKWGDCYVAYSGYLRTSYIDMMRQRENHVPVSPLIPLEKYGLSCEGIDKKYPFEGMLKTQRDQSAGNAISFIYLHELSHLFYRHMAFDTEKMSDSERQKANCIIRKQEKDADILAARKLVKFGWEGAALDVTIWMVMLNTGIIETSRNSNLDHPTALERMSYTLDEVRGAILSSGGHVSREMSEAIDEAKDLVKKADEQLGGKDDSANNVITCKD